MTNIPHIIEIAILLLIAFLIGCAIGWFFKSVVFRRRIPAMASALAVARVESTRPQVLKTTPASTNPAHKTTSGPVAVAVDPVIDLKPVAPAKQASKSATARTQSTKSASRQKAPTKSNPPPDKYRPTTLDAPRSGGKDNLKKINGIGPRLESLLNELGVYHFDQISAWDKNSIAWVEDYLSFKGRIERDNWVRQAKKLS